MRFVLVSELFHLFGKLCVDFKKLGNLFFKSSDSFIALFELLFKFSNVLNSDQFIALLEKNIGMPP